MRDVGVHSECLESYPQTRSSDWSDISVLRIGRISFGCSPVSSDCALSQVEAHELHPADRDDEDDTAANDKEHSNDAATASSAASNARVSRAGENADDFVAWLNRALVWVPVLGDEFSVDAVAHADAANGAANGAVASTRSPRSATLVAASAAARAPVVTRQRSNLTAKTVSKNLAISSASEPCGTRSHA